MIFNVSFLGLRIRKVSVSAAVTIRINVKNTLHYWILSYQNGLIMTIFILFAKLRKFVL